ncbi:hypothetical protein MC7420_5581 [Coleofasciculus chthonoplastes PCC 7420]|uniref:Uncharacterized protein n=1 Tax=Coleofasciculus chthonoplastes PCC 7420 TaxID=118168 RepID=B4VPC1_9CYAN|nr:hypothetical protein MC7420_5581 [Coleofasciculus chthonoplastes PCC 7420]
MPQKGDRTHSVYPYIPYEDIKRKLDTRCRATICCHSRRFPS